MVTHSVMIDRASVKYAESASIYNVTGSPMDMLPLEKSNVRSPPVVSAVTASAIPVPAANMFIIEGIIREAFCKRFRMRATIAPARYSENITVVKICINDMIIHNPQKMLEKNAINETTTDSINLFFKKHKPNKYNL